MRFLSILSLLLFACFGNASELQSAGDDSGPEPPFGSAPGACVIDEQCTLVGASCCECPTFATSVDDPKLAACDQVDCDTGSQVCPTNVRAACSAQNQCELACAPLACLDCPDGYFLEANGCLSCTCASAPTQAPSCTSDADCVRTRADCCGCDLGGDDTAVAAADAAAFDAALACGSSPQCPGLANTSEATCNEIDYTPRCALGSCVLAQQPMPDNACGRPDLPACPSGTTCTINANDSAILYGVGTCEP